MGTCCFCVMFIEFVFLWICVEKLAANTCRPDNTPYEEAYIPYPTVHSITFWSNSDTSLSWNGLLLLLTGLKNHSVCVYVFCSTKEMNCKMQQPSSILNPKAAELAIEDVENCHQRTMHYFLSNHKPHSFSTVALIRTALSFSFHRRWEPPLKSLTPCHI